MWIAQDDFQQNEEGKREVSSFEITASFKDLSSRERGRMATCLTPSRDPNSALLRLVASLDSANRLDVSWFGGDSMPPTAERWARDIVQHTYLHPLRDAAKDLRPGHETKLVRLLNALAPDSTRRRSEIETVAKGANELLDNRRMLDKTHLCPMRVTVCQLHDEPNAFDRDWSALCAHARRERSELVLLPEMPFGRWFAVMRPFDERRWRASVVIAVPRVTPASSRERWLVGGRAAAIVSGAFCVSSNRGGISAAGDPFGGQGWIIDPDGDVLAVTSDAEPFATRDLELARAQEAKTTYPRYVR